MRNYFTNFVEKFLSFFNVNTEDDLFTAREQYQLFDARNG